MALIGTIRNNMWLVIILLGIGMASFILMDMMSGNNSMFGGPDQSVGTIDGKEISVQDFQRKTDLRFGKQGTHYARQAQMWSTLVSETIIDNQAEKLGLNVTDEELESLVYGPNYSPIIIRDFPNQQFRQLPDTEQLNQIKELERTEKLNPEFAPFWEEEKVRVVKDQVQRRVFDLVSKSIYTPTWLAEMSHGESNGTAQYAYVHIPYDVIDNNEVNLTDDDYKAYINENAKSLELDKPTYILDYIEFDVYPTEKDSAKWEKELTNLLPEMRKEDSNSYKLFVESNQGIYDKAYYTKDQVGSDGASDFLFNGEVGTTYGPYLEGSQYKVARLLDRKVIRDSVNSRHILLEINPQDALAAQTLAKSIVDSIENKQATFDEMVLRYSVDNSNKNNGGEFGMYGPGKWVKEVSDLTLYEAEKGKLYTVESQFGLHIVEVTETKSSGKQGVQVAYLQRDIIPSKETQKSMLSKATLFAKKHRTLEAMKTAIEGDTSMTVNTTSPLDENAFFITGLGAGESSRQMVKWAISDEAKVGGVSPEIYRFSDEVLFYENKYVVAGLNSVVKAGVPTVDAFKKQGNALVMTKKKGDMILEKLPKDINGFTGVVAAYDELEVDTAFASFNNPVIAQLNTQEPKVIGNLFSLENGKYSKPIAGNGGVYVVQMINKTDATAPTNIPSLRSSLSRSQRQQVQGRLMPALVEGAKVEDGRSKFF